MVLNPNLLSMVMATRFTWGQLVCGLVTLFMCVSGCSNASPKPDANAVSDRHAEDRSKPPGIQRRELLRDVEVLSGQLDTPSGLAIQPGTGDLFVATLRGVLRLDADSSYAANLEIVGFPVDSYGKGPSYQFGPLGLAFRDSEHLIIGGGGKPDGEDGISIFRVADQPCDSPQNAAMPHAAAAPIRKGDQSLRGEGNYFGVLASQDRIFATSHGDDTKGWISEVRFGHGTLPKIEPLIAAKQATGRDGPTGLVLLPDDLLLVALIGELDEREDSLLAEFELATGKLGRSLATGLRDITAIVADSSNSQVYALDFSWSDVERGGLYSLTLRETPMQQTKLASLPHPTAMCLDASGDLFVATLGDPKPGQATGQVLRIKRP